MAANKVLAVIGRHKELKARKNFWMSHYQLLGEFIRTRKQNLTAQFEPGSFLNRDLWDATAITANNIMASALIGTLWPNGAKTFKLVRPLNIPDSQEVKDYYQKITEIITDGMDNSKAGLAVALEEYMNDQGAFGTSGVAVLENPENDPDLPILYKAWDVKAMTIDEGPNGVVDTIYMERELSVKKAVQEFGLENLSTKSQTAFKEGRGGDEIRILHAIEPRLERDPVKFGSKDMPIASIHIELGANKMIKESGFEEMPVFVVRFQKALGEMYGRCPGMAALPDIMELNALWEAITIAAEKQLDPPLVVLDDGKLGGGTINTSAGALNVFTVSGRIENKSPIQPLFTVGEFASVSKLIEKLVDSIRRHFLLDKLVDINPEETRKTLGEIQIRNEFMSRSMGSVFSRQETELFTPMIDRTFNIRFKKGDLGVMPESAEAVDISLGFSEEGFIIPESIANAIRKNREVFKIQYISPAKRVMQSEEVKGIVGLSDYLTTTGQIAPTMIDNFSVDEMVVRLSTLIGVPTELLNASDTVRLLREARAEAAQQQQQVETTTKMAKAAQSLSQAQQTGAGGL